MQAHRMRPDVTAELVDFVDEYPGSKGLILRGRAPTNNPRITKS
jgi:hypothetical protein